MAKSILVVDDEIDVATIVAFRLKKAGYNVLTAANGQGALDLIQKNTPDLILLDLLLPVMSGLELCKRLKADDKLRHIPVILFTSNAIMIKQVFKESQAEDYLIKPFEPEELLIKVKKYL